MTLIPPGSTETFLDLDGGRVRVLRSSTGHPDGRAVPSPVLLIHGGGTDNSAISWYEVFSALGPEREVVAVDLPGFGRTTGIEPAGGAPDLADFVARAMHELALSPAVVMGVSMGGDVALNLAIRHPQLVEALVLVAPGGLVPVFRNRAAQFVAWSAAQLPDVLLIPLTGLASHFVEAAIKGVVKDPDSLPPDVLDEFVQEARRPRAGLAYGRYNQASLGPWSMRNNLLPEVHRVSAPALFFHGQDDPLVDPQGSRRASELMPDARLVLVPDCGHWAQLEARDRFLSEVHDFLGAGGTGRRTGHEEVGADVVDGGVGGKTGRVRCVVAADHEIPTRAPLVLVSGDVVEVGERDREWPAFVFVTASRGTGWVPSRHLDIKGSAGTARVGYDTTELPALSGEHVDVILDDPESGWAWCRNAVGREGWIPHRVLTPA